MWGDTRFPLSDNDAKEIIEHPDRRVDETPLTTMMRWAGMDRTELPANFDHRYIRRLCDRQFLIEELRTFLEEREDITNSGGPNEEMVLLGRLQELWP